MNNLKLCDIGYSCESKNIINNVSLEVFEGDWLAIAGRNGSGKSTLLRVMANLIKPSTGDIFLNGKQFKEINNINQKLSIMSQRSEINGGMRVHDLVRLGRYPYLSSWQFKLSEEDEHFVENALNFTGLNKFKDRCVSSLSGGERQRAFLALALAQDGSILLFDEPTNHLDIVAQFQILQLLKQLASKGKTIISVLHDLNHIGNYCNKLALLKDGQLSSFGDTSEVLTSSSLSEAFEININVTSHGTRLHVHY